VAGNILGHQSGRKNIPAFREKEGHLGVSSIDRGHSEISPLDSGETPKYLPEIEG